MIYMIYTMMYMIVIMIYFRSAFFFTNIHNSQDSRVRVGNLFNSSLPIPSASLKFRH